jgi:sucrose phosphorylase
MNKIKDKLMRIYPDKFEEIYDRVLMLMEGWKPRINQSYSWVNEKDIMLITYGDGLRRTGEVPLKSLKTFLDQELGGYISAVHLLPMFPYTSDDGFSVSDFRAINPELGDWEDVEEIKKTYDLMFDAVINHASKSSKYFKEFLKGTDKFENFFISADPNKDYSKVIRPRALPLFTEFETRSGKKFLWTTFSDDQIDFNYKDPEVLLEILDILLLYASKGARFLRFDAIGFAWKEDDSTCMHLPQVHELVKLMRDVLETCVPGCTIITETNVPHKDNISYFGNGFDEAGLVYQFPLPPLVLHSFISGSARELAEWADSLEDTTEATTYFNFLASHDGIGMRPVEKLLSSEQIERMVQTVLSRGGQIGYRYLPDGSQVPYELNINYLDAIAGDETCNELMVQKYMCSQSILLSVVGMPGIYYHSILGSRNCYEDYKESGIKRRINREKLDLDQLITQLHNPESVRRKVINRFKEIIKIRRQISAFSPRSPQRVLFLEERVFSFVREGDREKVLVLINVSKDTVVINTGFCGLELFTQRNINREICMQPYEYMWIHLNDG